jgi:hypothetical protein
MTKPLLTLVADPAATTHNNPYGYGKIHFWVFNYDGNGSALVTHDDEVEFDAYGKVDVDNILMGDPGTGVRWYRRVD